MGRKRIVIVLAIITAVAAGLMIPAARSAQTLTVRQRLVRCLNAVNGLYVGPVKSGTPQVAILSRRVIPVRGRCNGDASLRGTQAGRALSDLSLGVSFYQQYLIGVAFRRADRSVLRDAQRFIALGRTEARRVL